MLDRDRPTPSAKPPRSKSVSVIALVAGLGTAAVGLFGVVSGSTSGLDILFLAGGLIVAVVGAFRLLGR